MGPDDKTNGRLPKLAAPGAGLPPFEAWSAGVAMRAMSRLLSTSRKTAMYSAEVDRCVALARDLTEEQGKRRVLVKRFPGIEDSSRHWSAFMVIEHLVIVGSAILDGIPRLARGEGLGYEVRIGDVKPSPESGPEQLERLTALAADFSRIVPGLGALDRGSRHVHPWFGALNAGEWLTLAAVHNRIHRHQMGLIVARL
jgi:hypothetical protein